MRSEARENHEESDNFVLITAMYIEEFYHWTQEYMFERLLANDFLRSIVASTALFAIGIKLTLELNACNLSRAVDR